MVPERRDGMIVRKVALFVSLAAVLAGCAAMPEQWESSPVILTEETFSAEPGLTEPEGPDRWVLCELTAADAEAALVFVYDPGAGELVYCSTEALAPVYPASITKLFSAWVALRFLPGDEEVTVGWELGLVEQGSSTALLALDSRLTVEELVQGMLLPSGNDAALTLAAAVGRVLLKNETAAAREAVAEFVAEMNRAAFAVGLQNTHFTNPHGWHSQDHYTCPADLGVMAALALDEPILRRAMGLSEITVTTRSGEVYPWRNTNRLVRRDLPGFCEEAIGMKTGYTDAAGYCLLAAFGEEDPLVVGVFGCREGESRYTLAEELYRVLTEDPVHTAALHQQVQSGAGQEQHDELAQGHINGVDHEPAADVDRQLPAH